MKLINFLLIVFVTILIFGLGSFCSPFVIDANADLDNGPWLMIRQNPQHTSSSSFRGPEVGYTKWKYSIGNRDTASSPALGSDGTIYQRQCKLIED